MAAHEICGEASGAVESGAAGVPPVFAHFDADGLAVTSAFIVGVLALLVGGEGLVDGMVINAEVPGEVAERIIL